MKKYWIQQFITASVVLMGLCHCSPANEPVDDKACTPANHCLLVSGVADCEEGYTWVNPDSSTGDFRCEVKNSCDCDTSSTCEHDCGCDPDCSPADAGMHGDGGSNESGSLVDAALPVCEGACEGLIYTECTCAPGDPCGWRNDGFCDLEPPDQSCAIYASHFDDSADCQVACQNHCTTQGSSRCEDGQLETCEMKASGCLDWSWSTCPDGFCQDSTSCGVCDHRCGSGETSCNNGQLRACVTDYNGCRDWGQETACSEGFCADAHSCGTCNNSCSSGETSCENGEIRRCEADANGCLAFSEPSACASGFCQGASSCGTCVHSCPGDGVTLCEDGSVQRCSADTNGCLAWSTAVLCSSGFCDDTSSCGQCENQCEEQQTRCEVGQLQGCVTDEQGCRSLGPWTACADGFCSDDQRCGNCQHGCDVVDSTRCADGSSQQICVEDEHGCRDWSSYSCDFGCYAGRCNTDSLGPVGDCAEIGHFVSRDTCLPLQQCGTLERPFCTIGKAIRSTPDAEVWVARSTEPYSENLILRDGIELLGGYTHDFSARDVDLQSNTTHLYAAGVILAWPEGIRATVDGFHITSTGASHGVLVIGGTANAILRHIKLDPAPRATAWDAVAILMNEGSGGSLHVEDSSVIASEGSDSSYALLVAASAQVSLLRSHFQAMDARKTSGIHLKSIDVPTGRSLDVVDCTVAADQWANCDQMAWCTGAAHMGLRVHTAERVHISGGFISGASGSNYVGDLVAGALIDSVLDFEIEGTSVVGSQAFHATYPPGPIVCGLRIINTKALAGAHASIEGVDIEGGRQGEQRRGIWVSSVPFTLSTSSVWGTRDVLETYDAAGPNASIAVYVDGVFEPDDTIVIKDNVELIGGDVQTYCSYYCDSAGIEFWSPVNSQIIGNSLIRAANNINYQNGAGVYIAAGGEHTIAHNAVLEAGKSRGGENNGIRITDEGSGPVAFAITISENDRIAGGEDYRGTGIYATATGTLTIEDNRFIFGGTLGRPRGIELDGLGITARIQNNHVAGGGPGGAGMLLNLAQGSVVSHNLVEACGMTDAQGQVRPECFDSNYSYSNVGLWVQASAGASINNNYVFGGYTSATMGCYLGTQQSSYTFPRVAMNIAFANNLCLASYHPLSSYPDRATATALFLSNNIDDASCPIIANNILRVEGEDASEYTLQMHNTCNRFLNNNFYSDWAALNILTPGFGTGSFANIESFNAASTELQHISANTNLNPGFVDDNLRPPRVENFHLDESCVLQDLGIAVQDVDDDYDGDVRPVDATTIGPDECGF